MATRRKNLGSSLLCLWGGGWKSFSLLRLSRYNPCCHFTAKRLKKMVMIFLSQPWSSEAVFTQNHQDPAFRACNCPNKQTNKHVHKPQTIKQFRSVAHLGTPQLLQGENCLFFLLCFLNLSSPKAVNVSIIFFSAYDNTYKANFILHVLIGQEEERREIQLTPVFQRRTNYLSN